MGTVSRTLQPQLAEYLYALSAADGADPSRDEDTGAAAARNGEPEGELGLVKQQDFAWQAQTGAPDDPQAGNIPGGPRDVLRSANFNNASSASGFFADSGVWDVSAGKLQVSAASLGADAASVYHIEDPLPGYFEIQASVVAVKPTAGWKANAYLIFDYQSPTDFRFAGIDVSTNKLVMGHRSATGWHIDKQASVQGGVRADKAYNVLVAINGVTATMVVDNNQVFSHAFAPRVVDGYAYGLNNGFVGVGSDNSRGTFDNVTVQVLPPQITLERTDNFTPPAELTFNPVSGTWNVQSGVYVAGATGQSALSVIDLGVESLNVNSYLELNTKVSTTGRAGFVFDRYEDRFKFVAIDAVTDQLIVGHYTAKKGWANDVVVPRVINAGAVYDLGISLYGTTASVKFGGQAVVGHVFNATNVDGQFGLLTTSSAATFDDVKVKTNDPAFDDGNPIPAIAAMPFAPGDANRDGAFNSHDLLQVWQIGEYEDDIADNSSWNEGDWNRDGEFTSADIVAALQFGAYERPMSTVAPDTVLSELVATQPEVRQLDRRTLELLAGERLIRPIGSRADEYFSADAHDDASNGDDEDLLEMLVGERWGRR
jgi:hypothetical protein